MGVRLAIAQESKAVGIAGDADDVGIDLVIIEMIVGIHQAGDRAGAEPDHRGAIGPPFLSCTASIASAIGESG